jgi:2-acylglycerol O-acyltransferase 2
MPFLWPILIPYVLWIVYVDKAPREGGRPKKWFKRLAIWRHFANYYPVSLVQEATLPVDGKYIFGYHPHGVIGMGALANFGTEGTNFSKIFPGITPHLLTLAPNFLIPFYRDILLHLGLCSVSKRACSTILRRGAPGTAIVIVIGGATESLRAHPGTNDLTLKRRMGFIKIAIREGYVRPRPVGRWQLADPPRLAQSRPRARFLLWRERHLRSAVRPVAVERLAKRDRSTDELPTVRANERGTTIYKVQKRFQAMFGFTLPMFHGRGCVGCLAVMSRLVCEADVPGDALGSRPTESSTVGPTLRPPLSAASR